MCNGTDYPTCITCITKTPLTGKEATISHFLNNRNRITTTKTHLPSRTSSSIKYTVNKRI